LRRLWPRLKNTKMPKLAEHLQSTIHSNYPTIIYNPPEGTPPWDTDGGEPV
jgi:hypothetical protein